MRKRATWARQINRKLKKQKQGNGMHKKGVKNHERIQERKKNGQINKSNHKEMQQLKEKK